MKEWITKIPEYFAGGGHVPGFATGGVSNLFRERQNSKRGLTVIVSRKFMSLIRKARAEAFQNVRKLQDARI